MLCSGLSPGIQLFSQCITPRKLHLGNSSFDYCGWRGVEELQIDIFLSDGCKLLVRVGVAAEKSQQRTSWIFDWSCPVSCQSLTGGRRFAGVRIRQFSLTIYKSPPQQICCGVCGQQQHQSHYVHSWVLAKCWMTQVRNEFEENDKPVACSISANNQQEDDD
jgi:hypothetical protein